jgi:hypothetical protein
MTEVRSPAEAEEFSSSLCVQTGSEAYPASNPGCDITHLPSSAEVKNKYTSSPPKHLHDMYIQGTGLLYMIRVKLVRCCTYFSPPPQKSTEFE